jgi:signal recognition particle subunit SRP19
MSRKAAIVEEFDDETDLPLPSQPLPSTGGGPVLQEIDVYDDAEPSQRAGSASSFSQPQFRPDASGANRLEPKNTVTDITPYKTCVLSFLLRQSNY